MREIFLDRIWAANPPQSDHKTALCKGIRLHNQALEMEGGGPVTADTVLQYIGNNA